MSEKVESWFLRLLHFGIIKLGHGKNWSSDIAFCIVIYRHLFAVQLTTYQWDTPSYRSLQWQQQLNRISTPWAVAYQTVMWLMESLRLATTILCGWILATSKTNSIFIILASLNEDAGTGSSLPHNTQWDGSHEEKLPVASCLVISPSYTSLRVMCCG